MYIVLTDFKLYIYFGPLTTDTPRACQCRRTNYVLKRTQSFTPEEEEEDFICRFCSLVVKKKNLPDDTLASFKRFKFFSIAYNLDGKYVQIMDKDILSPVCQESFTRNKNSI